jgi:hypothetical protein
MASLKETCIVGNVFDNLPALAAPMRTELRDEIEAYLQSDPEAVNDVLAWWYGKQQTYPNLSQMALDYLSIPGSIYSFSESRCG